MVRQNNFTGKDTCRAKREKIAPALTIELLVERKQNKITAGWLKVLLAGFL
jgi:hypothetical protein